MSLQTRLAAVIAAIGADVKAMQSALDALGAPRDVYRWTTSLNAAEWSSYTATVSNANGLLRFTNNTADSGDAQLLLTVVPGRTYAIRANLAGVSSGFPGTPNMHLGHAGADYGGYGFEYALGVEHSITAIDDTLSIYIDTQGGGLGEWIELSELYVLEEALPDGIAVSHETADFTAAANTRHLLAASSLIATLPAAPAAGFTTYFALSSASITGCVVTRNGELIMELAEDMTVDREIGFGLCYDAAFGWRLV